MTEELDLLGLLIDKIEYQITINKNNLKRTKHDIKKLEKSKADVLEVGIADYVFDDNINCALGVKETLEKRINVLKKVKYRLDVAKRMMNELN